MMGPADVEGSTDVKRLANTKKHVLADAKKPIFICYKHQYYHKYI